MSSNNIFRFKPEVEENIIITHRDLTIGLAEVSPLMREIIFAKKFGKRIQKRNEEREKLFKQRQEKRKRNKEEDVEKFMANFKCSKSDNWLNDDEEQALFIEHFVEEIRLDVEKKQRYEDWIKNHFF